uniref:Uncharacterized protein n=1 Tax=Tetranychus urticae TaxID=32264 RepID=T1KSJ5_TETUR
MSILGRIGSIYRHRRLILSMTIRTMMAFFCAYQLRSITETYIRGETISKVNLSFPEFLTLPSVTLCFDFIDTLNVTRLSGDYPYILKTLQSRDLIDDYVTRHSHLPELYYLLGNHSLASMKGYMNDNIDFLLAKITPTQLEPDDGLKVNCNVTRYLIEPNFCHTITCYHVDSDEPAKYPRSTIFEPRYGGRMLIIELESWVGNLTKSMSIHFTVQSSLLYSTRTSSYLIDLTHPPTTFTVSYSMIRNDLDSIASETKCLPSGSFREGTGNRNQRFYWCINELIRSSFGCSSYGSAQDFDDPNMFHLKLGYHQYYREFLSSNLTQRDIDRAKIKKIRQQCISQLKAPNCIDEIYSPIGDSFSVKDKSDYTIIVDAPSVPFENNEFSLEIALLDYLIYISSSLNFWFGISIISVVDHFITTLFEWIDSKKLKSKETKPPSPSPQFKAKIVVQPIRSRVLTKFNSLNRERFSHYYSRYHSINQQ